MNTPVNPNEPITRALSPYTLSKAAEEEFERLWRNEISFFPENPAHHYVRSQKAKEFAKRVYALTILNTQK